MKVVTFQVVNGILASKQEEIISFTMTCRNLLWTHMKNAVILHACTYLISMSQFT